jgi:type II secretory pathway pseudopilin PulG
MTRTFPCHPRALLRRVREAGFTLIELLITLMVLIVVVGALTTVLMTASRSKTASTNRVESVQAARVALDMMARDLRCAGYGADLDWTAAPQPTIAYIDSMEVLINTNLSPWPDSAAVHAPPVAYNPSGNPRPAPLNGTSWEPPIRYRTGAEVVRYTLDVNNDGAVNANDVASAEGVDARRTPNPDDFVLVRQVYGDSTGGVAGNNGGQLERIALVRRPGGTVPPMFTVYLRGSGTPWNWANGAIPASQLPDVQRIVVQVAAPSGKPDSRGTYAQTVLRTEVNSMRNVPDFGQPEYAVDGYVYNDLNQNHVRDAGESGLAGVTVLMGTAYTTYTAGTGYFIFHMPAGTYTLRHTPPAGYGCFTSPDSFVVTVPPAVQRSFADTARTGGWVTAYTFEDTDGDGISDPGELALSGVRATLSPGGSSGYTDASGTKKLFASVGGYSLAVTPPDSFMVTSANPATGTMADGDSARHEFGLQKANTGTVAGKVFRDNNRNGVYDTGEPGLQGVWVGATPDGGVTILGYQYTDANGDYSITVPANDPPHTRPYSVFCIPPGGYFPTNSTSIAPLWIAAAATVANNNFGMAGYQVIRLDANRVLSLASGDLIEKDWNGNQTQNARKDIDIVLGADAGGTDNISVWFNQYDDTPLFTTTSTYTRNAPQSVLALALDTLDTSSPVERPDVVTGTKNATNGNFFAWLTQNSSGNLGYLPTTFSPGLNYRTQDAGDVQAVLTLDCIGGQMPDIIAGTKSPTAGRGTFEIWQSNDAASPTYSRQETYPPSGSIPGGLMGEVNAMVLADLDGDGLSDLVVGTRTGSYSGELLVFKNCGKSASPRFACQNVYNLSDRAITALTCLDVDGDGWRDVVAGTQSGAGSGSLIYWLNKATPTLMLEKKHEVDAPGAVMSLASTDLGGLPRKDVIMGWRQSEGSYVGGVRIYYTDLGTLPPNGVDPSSGSVTNMVPALTINNFNYGVKPAPPSPPFLEDFAAGVKISLTTGALVVFIR